MAAVDRLRDHDSVVVTLPRGHYISDVLRGADPRGRGMTVALEVEDKGETARLPDRVPNAFLTFRHADSLVGFRGTLHTARPSVTSASSSQTRRLRERARRASTA